MASWRGRRVVGSQHDEHPARPEDALDGDQNVQAPWHPQSDGAAGLQPRGDEPVRELVGSPVELGRAEGRVAMLGHDPVRLVPEPPPDLLVHGLAEIARGRVGGEQIELGPFGLADDGPAADRLVGSVEDGGDDGGEVGREAGRSTIAAERIVEVEFPLQSRDVVGGGARVVEHLGTQWMVGIDVARAHPLGHGGHPGEVPVPGRQHVEDDLEAGVGTLAGLGPSEEGHDRAQHPGEQRVMGVVVLDRDGQRVQLHQRSDQADGVARRAVVDRHAHDDAGPTVETVDGDRRRRGGNGQEPELSAERPVLVGEHLVEPVELLG